MDVNDDETVNRNPLKNTPMPIPSECFPSDIVLTQLACGDRTTFTLSACGEIWEGHLLQESLKLS